jgi:hypothetical protein
MEPARELFADGIGEITLAGGMVRMSLVTLVGSRREGDQPRFEQRERIVMPPDGFLRSFSAMEDLVKQLINAGLVKPRSPEVAAEGSKPSPAPTSTQSPPKSPNF